MVDLACTPYAYRGVSHLTFPIDPAGQRAESAAAFPPQPLEPPLAAKFKAEQALHFAESLAPGELQPGKDCPQGFGRKGKRDDLIV